MQGTKLDFFQNQNFYTVYIKYEEEELRKSH